MLPKFLGRILCRGFQGVNIGVPKRNRMTQIKESINIHKEFLHLKGGKCYYFGITIQRPLVFLYYA
jgi:hypothetical protein